MGDMIAAGVGAWAGAGFKDSVGGCLDAMVGAALIGVGVGTLLGEDAGAMVGVATVDALVDKVGVSGGGGGGVSGGVTEVSEMSGVNEGVSSVSSELWCKSS